MSLRAYRLLRNNSEQGPFTAEELIQKKLNPYDLVWVDGRSATWDYPGEMAEFKMYVPLPGEQNQNPQNSQKENLVSASVQAAVAINNNMAQSAIREKPRYKVYAAWSKIQTITAPFYKNTVAEEPRKKFSKKIVEASQPQNLKSQSLSWEEAWLDWEKEKRSASPVNETAKAKKSRVKQSKKNNENYTTPVIETKYEEPLDRLKDKYIENILQQKKKVKKGFSAGKAFESAIPVIAVLVIFGIGFWLLHYGEETAAVLNTAPLPKQQAAPAPTNIHIPATSLNDNTAAKTDEDPAFENKQNSSVNDETEITDQAEERKYIAPPKPVVIKQDGNLKKQMPLAGSNSISIPAKTANQQVQPVALVKNNIVVKAVKKDTFSTHKNDLNTNENKIVRSSADTGSHLINSVLQKNVLPAAKHIKTSTDYVSVPEYVPINNGNANLKIENISDVDLDLVVIDVQYFDSLSQFRKGETLYLHNLRAGKNVIIKTPKDINSYFATSKVSLISSDAKQVYVVGDN